MDELRNHLKLIEPELNAYLVKNVEVVFACKMMSESSKEPHGISEERAAKPRLKKVKQSISSFEIDGAPVIGMSLDDYLEEDRETFQQMLFRIIEEKGLKTTDVYKKANMSKQTFSKIRWNEDYHPHKRTAIALAISLELTLDETNEFLSKAGYTLKSSLVEDMVVQFFIEMKIYNLMEIDMALSDRNLPTICNYY